MKALEAYLREVLGTFLREWNRFWFTPADPATLGVIRLMTGAILLYSHLAWTIDLVGFFGPEGRLPIEFAQQFQGSEWAWSFLYAAKTPTTLWIMHLASLVVLTLFLVGLLTRLTSVLAFLITVSYAHRAVGALFGLDQVLGFLTLYLAVGPSGAAFSIDQWWRHRKRSSNSGSIDATVMANIAVRLIQVHMCIVYLFAGLGKLLGQTWWAGTALWGAFANFEYQTVDMTWLAGYPLAVNFITQLILFWEVSYCVFIWPRLTRPIFLALAVPLHLGIAVCMGMMTFGLAMLVGNFAFVPPEAVRSLATWVSGSLRPSQGRGVTPASP